MPDASPAPPAHDWVPVTEAAEAIGVSAQHLRRQCEREYRRRGLAKRMSTVPGRRACWHLSAAAHPRLTRRASERLPDGSSAVNVLLSEAPADKRAEAESRARAMILFRRWRAGGAKISDAAAFRLFRDRVEAETGLRPSKASLYDWDARCPSSDDFAGCVAELLDTRGRPKAGAERVSDAAWRCFCGLYLAPQQRALKHCWDLTRSQAREAGWAWPSEATVRRLVKERLDPATLCMAREGEDAWNKRHLAPLEQDPDAWAAGECWESDHSRCDFFARVQRGGVWVADRPWLTTWMDRRSRRLMGWVISDGGSSSTIRAALAMALRDPDVGAPEKVWLDNGKDFASAAISGVTKAERRRGKDRDADAVAANMLGMLGIRVHWARPYNHNGKARQERAYGFSHERFDKSFDSYCGANATMLDKRAREMVRKDVMALPTLDEVRERFAEWAAWYNAIDDHRIESLVDPEVGRLSRDAWYQRHLPAKRVVDPGSLRVLERVWSRPLKVQKWGVSLKIAGCTARYGEGMDGRVHPALEPLVGSDARVMVSYDETDLSRVSVWDESFRFLADVKMNSLYGGAKPSRQDLQAAFADRREQKRRVRRKIDLASLTLGSAELVARAAIKRETDETRARLAERLGPEAAADAPPLRLVQTPVDGEAEREAEAMRKAAGAEHDDWAGDPGDFRLVDLLARDAEQASADDDDDVMEVGEDAASEVFERVLGREAERDGPRLVGL